MHHYIWQVTSPWCGAGDGFHSCQQKACQNFSINNTLPCQQIMLFHCVLSGFGNTLSVSFFSVSLLKNSIVSMMNLQRILPGAFWFTFSIQISLISLCSPWENSVTDHINTVLTKSEFQLSPASPVAQSDVSIRQLSVTVSFVRGNWFTSDKKVVSPASFLLLVAWNSETHWLTSFDASSPGSQVNMQRRLWFMQFDQWRQLVNFTLPSCSSQPLSLSFGNLFVSMKDTIQVC